MLARTHWMPAGELFRPLFDFGVSWPFDGAAAADYRLRVDVVEKDDRLELVCDVPGVQSEDTEITMENGVLTISARRKIAASAGTLRLAERSGGQFTRAFQLGDGYDPERVSATLHNGVLVVCVAKRPQTKPKKVPIQFGAGPANKQLGAAAQPSQAT